MTTTERHRQLMRELKAIREACEKIVETLEGERPIMIKFNPDRFKSSRGISLSDDLKMGKVE